jgi:hypothetical protein
MVIKNVQGYGLKEIDVLIRQQETLDHILSALKRIERRMDGVWVARPLASGAFIVDGTITVKDLSAKVAEDIAADPFDHPSDRRRGAGRGVVVADGRGRGGHRGSRG